MSSPSRVLASALALATLSTAARAQSRDDLTWSETLPAGARLTVHNARGPVEVRAATGNRAELRGVIEDSRGESPRLRVVREGSNVTLCVLPDTGGECTADGIRRDSRDRYRRDDWPREGSARVTVLLPRGLRLDARTNNGTVSVDDAGGDVDASSGNGRVRVTRAAGEVHASSGNGDVRVVDAGGPVDASSGNGEIEVSTAAGPVSASSGNGTIEVRMRSLRGSDAMRFSSGNGSILVWLPGDFAGEVSANGQRGFTSDFPIALGGGGLREGRIRGTIGRGGARIDLSTGNGQVELRRLP